MNPGRKCVILTKRVYAEPLSSWAERECLTLFTHLLCSVCNSLFFSAALEVQTYFCVTSQDLIPWLGSIKPSTPSSCIFAVNLSCPPNICTLEKWQQGFSDTWLHVVPVRVKVWTNYTAIWECEMLELQFTLETDPDRGQPFSDVYGGGGGSRGRSIYWKLTHANLCLNNGNHHHPFQRGAVLFALVHRAYTISDLDNLPRELEYRQPSCRMDAIRMWSIVHYAGKQGEKAGGEVAWEGLGHDPLLWLMERWGDGWGSQGLRQ